MTQYAAVATADIDPDSARRLIKGYVIQLFILKLYIPVRSDHRAQLMRFKPHLAQFLQKQKRRLTVW